MSAVLLTSLVVTEAYPYFANGYYQAETLRGIKPGDIFFGGQATKMHIANFEPEYDDNCVIVPEIPESGFDDGKKYSISVTSTADGGVGHAIFTSAGEFDNEDQEDTYLYEKTRMSVATGWKKHASLTWRWSSASVIQAEFYAICSDGDYKKAWLARPVIVNMTGAPTTPCSTGDEPLASPCLCPDVSAAICGTGRCCFENNTCGDCGRTPSPPPFTTATPALVWLHSSLMVLAWACCMPIGVAFARNRQRMGGWFPLHSGLQKVGFTFQLAGLVTIIVYLNQQGLPHFSGPGEPHMITGIILIVLSSVQVLLALFRPHQEPQTAWRVLWERFHGSLGYLLLALGIAAMVLGMWAARDDGATIIAVMGTLAAAGLGTAFWLSFSGKRVDPPVAHDIAMNSRS